jgi:DNA-binding transcriptional LysR family regulator
VSDSLVGAIAMLTESDCIARLPRAILDHPLAAGQLVEIPVREQAVHEICIVRRSGRRLGREAQTLASMLKSFARVLRSRVPGAPFDVPGAAGLNQ